MGCREKVKLYNPKHSGFYAKGNETFFTVLSTKNAHYHKKYVFLKITVEKKEKLMYN